jgi:hypothetical protein
MRDRIAGQRGTGKPLPIAVDSSPGATKPASLRSMSAFRDKSDLTWKYRFFRFSPILLQKSVEACGEP